ncbi:hypothetical protein QQ008_19300 [Fulvivirgaceae bacterium BMA10]|uniref:Tetratricopeptide repeat protein n=1 Tax=Splendidivirga corallicola TaxID=3051826 RepID=A0ABT8KTP7_9BACT|nr:hypothetical protein [Fulvivirgaceae bacterium BMA10]
MKAVSVFLMVSILSVAHLKAQDYEFRVLANKGENMVKKEHRNIDWEPIKTGTKLRKGSVIRIEKDAYIGLVHHTGRTYEIVEPGNYTVDRLSTALQTSHNGISAKYANYVLSKFSDNTADVQGNFKKYQSATGAVKRALGNVATLNVLIPTTSEIYNSEILIRWNEIAVDDPVYIINFKNKYSEPITSIETKESAYILNMDDHKFVHEELVIVDIQLKGDGRIRSGEYGVKRLTGEKELSVRKGLRELKGDITKRNAMSELLLASFYEDNHLLADALTHYESAITMAPQVDEFKMIYEQFIKRTGLGR